MVSRQDIQATCDDIVREFSPLQVVLFGSYAYGRPTESSDVDLLVVMPVAKSETRRQEVEIRKRLERPFHLHVLVHSPEDLAYRLVYNDWFLREITEKGEVLYETPNFFLKPVKKEEDAMNPLTEEWVQKAEGDYTVAQQSAQGQNPVNDVICFLTQQCVEKYLKAWLQEANIPFPRPHDLQELLNLIVRTLPAWDAWREDFSKLSEHAVDPRYPGKFATADETAHAMHICNEVRRTIREHLNLSPESS
ncbi:HEPN domain-containing protein [Candidatus Poribacteria bacterium]|nr:HEPN domain-containing protein [Candidatus Poribacteria bacterium]MYG05474.1 HEPN domain-containing protein [Candidatus Poribacteria bacterium]MYK23035.1 HEPN domain-containing protein [Candidatus Poribacteria bacterium]